MGQTISEAVIKLELENKELKAKLGESLTQVETFKSKMASASQFMQKNWVALTAGIGFAVVAVKAVTRVVKEWVTDALEAQKVNSLLENTVKLQTAAYKQVTAQLIAFADAQQKVTKYGDEETKSVMTDLMAKGIQYADVLKVTSAAMDLASGRQISLSEAGGILSRAYNGQVEGLKRYGITIETSGNKTKDFEAVLGFVQKRMGGLAEIEGKTWAGRLAILNNRWGEIKETMGTKLLPVLIDTFTWWEKILGVMEKALGGNEKPMDPLLKSLDMTKTKFGEMVTLAKRVELEGGTILDPKKWGGNIIKMQASYITLTDQEMVLFKIAQDRNKAHEFSLSLQKQINAVTNGKTEAEKKAREELEAQLKLDKEIAAKEEEKANLARLDKQLAEINIKANKEALDKNLSDAKFSYDQRKLYLDTFYQQGLIDATEYNQRLASLDQARLEDWKQKNAAQVAITLGSYEAMSSAFADEFTKNVGQTLDKLNINFNNIFLNIRDAFFSMLLQMAAKAAAFGILNFITGGALGVLTGGLKFNKGGEVKGYADGGTVSGSSGVDTVPAMLTAGEFVVNKAATKMYRPLLEGINNVGRQKMASGGSVTSSKSVIINAPIDARGAMLQGGLSEKMFAQEVGNVLKRNGII